jgi:purine-binding chemotaxis protein CheW
VPDLLAFALGEHRLALIASAVVEVARVVATEPLPGAPAIVEGAINVRGTLVPVLDIRARFGLPAAEISLDQHLIIAQAGPRRVALRVDRALELVRVDEDAIEPSEEVVPGARYVGGVAKLSDGVLVFHDLERFLALDEGAALDAALGAAGAP